MRTDEMANWMKEHNTTERTEHAVRAESDKPTTRQWVIVSIGLAAAFLLLVWLGRGFWFYVDDWNFLLLRDGGSVDGLLRPHVNHWQTTQVIWYRLAYNIVGLESYLPFLSAAVAMHVAASGAMMWALRRNGARTWLSVSFGVLLLFFGNGGSDFAHGLFVGGGLGRLAYAIVIGLLATRTTTRSRVAVAALLMVAVMSSGLGINVTIGVLVGALLVRRFRELWWVTLPAVSASLVWYYKYGLAAVKNTSGSTSANIVEGLREALITTPLRFAESMVGVGQIVGGAVFVLLLVALAVRILRWNIRLSEWVGILAAGGFLLQLGIVRFAAGGGFRPGAGTPRYMYVLAFLLIPFVAATTERMIKRFARPQVSAAVALVLTVGIGANVLALNDAFALHTERSVEIRQSVEAAATMVRAEVPYVRWAKTHPRWTEPLTLGRLSEEIGKGWSIGTLPENTTDQLVIEFVEESRLVRSRHYSWQRAAVGIADITSDGGCVPLSRTTEFSLVKSGDGWFEGPRGAKISVTLLDGDWIDVDTFVLQPPQTRLGYKVISNSRDATLLIEVDVDGVVFCGVQEQSSN